MKRILTAEEFETWLANMGSAIESLLAMLPDDVAGKLDYSVDSLDVLEGWLLNTYPTYQAILEDSQYPILDGAARYVGELFRKYLGGGWDIELEDRENAYLGYPSIFGYRNIYHSVMSPYPSTWVTASLDRRRGNFMSDLMRSCISRAG